MHGQPSCGLCSDGTHVLQLLPAVEARDCSSYLTLGCCTLALHLEPRNHPTQVSVVSEAHSLITDSARLDALFRDGYQFESAAAQVLIVEALSVMYLLLQAQAHGLPIVDKKGRKTELSGNISSGEQSHF